MSVLLAFYIRINDYISHSYWNCVYVLQTAKNWPTFSLTRLLSFHTRLIVKRQDTCGISMSYCSVDFYLQLQLHVVISYSLYHVTLVIIYMHAVKCCYVVVDSDIYLSETITTLAVIVVATVLATLLLPWQYYGEWCQIYIVMCIEMYA